MKMYAGKSELSVFDHAVPQVVVDASTFEEIYPKDTIAGYTSSQIEFNVIGSDSDYLDLNDTLLVVKLKVVQYDGKDITTEVNMVPSNFLMHALFKDVTISLNNVKVEDTNDMYTQKAFIETILNMGSDTKKTFLKSIGYDTNDDERKKWIQKSATITLCGPLNLDLLDQPIYLLPGIDVNLKLTRNVGSVIFKYIKSSTETIAINPEVYINEAKLIVRRVKVNTSVSIGHQVGLESQNAIYPLQKSRLVQFSVPSGSLGEYKDNLFSDDRLPKFVLIALQSGKQVTGDYSVHASTFQNCNIKSLTLMRNVDYREFYTTNFEKDDYTQAYVQSMIRNMGLLNKDRNNGITLDDFKDKYPFFTFVLAPDFDIEQTQLPKTGNLKLDIRFNKALTETMTMFVYGVFDSEIQITKTGMVIV